MLFHRPPDGDDPFGDDADFDQLLEDAMFYAEQVVPEPTNKNGEDGAGSDEVNEAAGLSHDGGIEYLAGRILCVCLNVTT